MSTKTKLKAPKLPLATQVRELTAATGNAPFVTCPLCKHTQVKVLTVAEEPAGAIVAGDRTSYASGTFLDKHEIPDPARVIHEAQNDTLYVSVECPASGAWLRRANVQLVTRR